MPRLPALGFFWSIDAALSSGLTSGAPTELDPNKEAVLRIKGEQNRLHRKAGLVEAILPAEVYSRATLRVAAC